MYAVSHGLQSAPHTSFQAVPPDPPLEVLVTSVAENNVSLAWLPPKESLFTMFIIKYRALVPGPPGEEEAWSEVPVGGDQTSHTLTNLSPGHQFTIQLNTASFNVASGQPVTTFTTIDPSPVTFDVIDPILDAENVTLQWPVPAGLVETYYMSWHPADDPNDVTYKIISGDEVETLDSAASVLVDNLRPGVEYEVEVTTESNERKSPAVRTRVRTQPLCTSELTPITHQEVSNNQSEPSIILTNQSQVSDALTLRYTPTPLQRSTFDEYRFMLSPGNLVKEKEATNSERKVTFLDLVPGRLYNITMWTVSAGVTSRPVERQDRLHPKPVANIQAVEITDKTITLDWNIPQGDFDLFEVKYQDTQGFLIQNFTEVNSITIGGLRPFKNYTFTVVTIAGSDQSIPKRSTPISSFFTTKEGVPGSLSSFEPIDVKPNLITFQWDLPDVSANGVITGFTIHWGPKPFSNKPFIPENSTKFDPHEYQGTISDLTPGQKYTFQIQAQTKIGYGPPLRKEQKMPILAPPVPARSVFPTEVSRTMHTITIR